MKRTRWILGTLCCAALLLAAGCQTFPDARGLSVSPVLPKENEQIVRDQVLILVDSSDSVCVSGAFCYEKELARAFVGALPDGTYEAGLTLFGGVPESQWKKHASAPFDRQALARSAADLKMLGGYTPLAGGVKSFDKEVRGKTGRSALLVFSDGEVCNRNRVLKACEALKAAHGGELCIFTVHVGKCTCGKKLMQEMASVNGCGKYYDGETLNSAAAIQGLVRDIMFGPKEPAPAAPGPKASRTKIILNNVLFDFDKSVLKPEGKAEVDKLVGEMKAHPKDTVVIEGHTCDIGTDEYNMGLGQRRADSVKTHMLQGGIDAGRVATKSYGESKPAVANDSEANRKLNRRAEFNITLGQE